MRLTLLGLSTEYRANAAAMRGRIQELKARAAEPGADRLRLGHRIRDLSAMEREARAIAVLLERYYERGYRRNARYTL